MIKLIAFDWNGTILSDVIPIVRANNKVLKHFGFKKITVKKYQETFKIPIRDYWIALGLSSSFFDKHVKEQEKIFRQYYEPEEQKCRTRSGTKEMLQFLVKGQIDRIIFSNHITKHIDKQLKRLKISKYITKILARPINGRRHQTNTFKDRLLAKFVSSKNIKPHEVVVVGDTEEEIEIAKKFGYITVALTGGHNTTARLKAQHPDYLIHNLKELKSIIKKLNR